MRLKHIPRIPYFLVIPVFFFFFVIIALYVRIFIVYKKYVIRRQSFCPDDLHNNKAIITTLLIFGTLMTGWVPYSAVRMCFFLFWRYNIHFKSVPGMQMVHRSCKSRFDKVKFFVWCTHLCPASSNSETKLHSYVQKTLYKISKRF